MSISTVQPQELHQLRQSGQSIHLVDVRTPVEFQALHAEGASNHPLDQLDPAAIMQARNGSAEQPLYLICQMGGRSMQACQKFVAQGFANVVNVEGGTMLWEQQGLPVTKGEKQVMAMDRQVRIAAGSFVVLGTVLAVMLPEAVWLGLGVAFLIGAGLIYSGATNTCGMASVLAKMPWNQTSGNC